MDWLAGLFSFLSAPVTQFIKNRGEVALAKHRRKLKVITGEQDWDSIQAANSAGSWKDEFLTVFFSMPFMIPFWAALVGDEELLDRVNRAFVVLDTNVPSEYWYIMSAIVAASFGLKSIVKGVGMIRQTRQGGTQEPPKQQES